MHGEFLQDLAVVMLVAGVVTAVFQYLNQPVVLGYIIAGVIVGPHTNEYIRLSISDEHTVQIMSELGMILLMFGLGLHFSLRRLVQVGPTALLAAGFEIVVMFGIGYTIGQAFSWSRMDSVFLGAMLSMSSTTVIIKALNELGLTKHHFADLIFGILIVEDILGIAMIALLSGIAATGELSVGDVTTTLLKLSIFLASVLAGGLLIVPALLRQVSKLKSNETMLVVSLGLCFGVSLLALRLEYSVALGAFLIGAIIAEARERGKIEALVEPVRDMFSAIFFVAIGMLIDPSMLRVYWLPIAVITIAVIVVKVITCAIGTFIAGNDPKTALRVGMGLAQIGEFSFIIAQLGREKNVTSDFLYPIAVAVSAVTTLLTPYLIRMSDRVATLSSGAAPVALADSARLYSRWMSLPRERKGDHQIKRLLRKWLLQIALNLALVTGIFIIVVASAPAIRRAIPSLPGGSGSSNFLLFLAAVLLSLPLLVATIRKLRAMAHVLAEMSVTKAAAGEQAPIIRTIIANTILVFGTGAIVALLLALGSTILPPWYMLILLLVVVIGITALSWRSLVRVYAKAQVSLHQTLTRVEEPELPPPQVLPTALRDALLEAIDITPTSSAANKLIRELELRSRSGASAVAIERNGSSLVNPGPDEEILPGDRVLLLGSRSQLDAARALLSEAKAAN